jgi:fucose permease
MWGDDVATPLNLVHLGYGFGAVFANLLVKPFLGDSQTIEQSKDNQTIFIKNELTNIQIPYSITSFLCLIISIIHLIFSIREYRNRRESLDNRPINYSSVSNCNKSKTKISEYSPRSWGNGSFNYGLLMSIIWIFYMFFLSGNDQTFGKFFFEYLKTPKFAISSQGATWGMIIYWLSYSV